MRNKCIVLLVLLMSSIMMYAQELPMRAMGCPVIFLNEELSYIWEDVASNPQHYGWNETSRQYWTVYVDREGVRAYAESSTSSSVNKTLKFMENYLVARVEHGMALLYTDKEFGMQTNLGISEKAVAIGWVEIDKLLLWSTCPRTQGQVYQKAIMVRDIEEISDKKDLMEASPYFLKSPTDKSLRTTNRAIELEIYFVFKRVEGAALCLKESTLEIGKQKDIVNGWMRKGLYTSWNERLCYEPNFGEDAEGGKSAIFTERMDAAAYKLNPDATDATTLIWEEKCPAKRWKAEDIRFPVTNIDKGSIASVGTIGRFEGTGKKMDSEANKQLLKRYQEVKAKIEVMEQRTRMTNIVFVVDGTKSMRNYYKPIADAIAAAMLAYSAQGKDVRFGAVVYRNYDDEANGTLIESFPLSKDYNEFQRWLLTRECLSEGKEHPEAMFHGIMTAIDKMEWTKASSNFLFLIGDAGNPTNDKKGYSEETIANAMVKKDINFIAFQANHPSLPAYDMFVSQVQRISHRSVELRVGSKIKRTDFMFDNRFYDYTFKNEYMILSIGYGFCDPNNTEEAMRLKNIVEKKISDFMMQTEHSIDILKRMLDEIGNPAGASESDREAHTLNYGPIMEKTGLTKQEIQVLADMNGTVKVKGFASRRAGSIDVFTTSAFMTATELQYLIDKLKTVTASSSINVRRDLQNALKELCLSYLGQQGEDVEVDDIMDAMRGVTSTGGRRILAGVSLKDILNPNLVTDGEINQFIRDLSKGIQRLIRIKEDKSCYYVSPTTGKRYYYILMEDMPMMDD